MWSLYTNKNLHYACFRHLKQQRLTGNIFIDTKSMLSKLSSVAEAFGLYDEGTLRFIPYDISAKKHRTIYSLAGPSPTIQYMAKQQTLLLYI